MIRIVVLVLAAANLMYFGWSRWVDQEAPRLVAPEHAGITTSVSSVAPAADSGAVCTMVGPAADEVHAMEIDQLLRDQQLLPLRRTVTAEVPDGWWVHLDNADAAGRARALRALRNAGHADPGALPDDPQFRISIGLFPEQARAEDQAAAVRTLGLEPTVARRMRQDTAHWFELPGTPASAVDLSRLAAEGVETAALRLQPCEGEGDVSIDAIMPPGAAVTAPVAAGPAV